MVMPCISFKPLKEGTTEYELGEYINAHPEETAFLVYLRCRYRPEDKWEYIIEACYTYGYCGEVEWFSDWYEGQKYVEYLGITHIDEYVHINSNN